MWLVLAFLSAALLGFYDAFKKKALSGNAVIPVLFLNTLFSSLIFLPFIVMSYTGNSLDGTMFHVAEGGWEVHKYIVLKSFIVLSSWIFGYFGMKHLPLTIVGPINATLTWNFKSSEASESFFTFIVPFTWSVNSAYCAACSVHFCEFHFIIPFRGYRGKSVLPFQSA